MRIALGRGRDFGYGGGACLRLPWAVDLGVVRFEKMAMPQTVKSYHQYDPRRETDSFPSSLAKRRARTRVRVLRRQSSADAPSVPAHDTATGAARLHRAASMWTGGLALLEILERLAIRVFPSGKAICPPSVNYCGGGTRTAELHILGEGENAIRFNERPVLN